MNYPREVSETIRAWLEYVPEKVLYATDAYPFAPPESGWEESGYVADKTGREALGIALTGMMRDGEITRDRAFGTGPNGASRQRPQALRSEVAVRPAALR